MTELHYIEVDDEVYLAARSLQEEADALGLPVFMLAEREKLKHLENGNKHQAQLWKAVWDFEMTCECVSAGTPILINTAKS
jgi:hypothetical protein